MVADEAPLEVVQWDKKYLVSNKEFTGINFYSNDSTIIPVCRNPEKYLDLLKDFYCVIGMDLSPYDNMPLVLQKYNIYLNLAITYFFGKHGIKIIPNVRIGSALTLDTLLAYPKHTLISIGTNGFVKNKENRNNFLNQFECVINYLEPTKVLIYGSLPNEFRELLIKYKIPYKQYDSFIMTRAQIRNKKNNER